MKLEFKIDEQDFLDFHLFTASQSDRIKRKMRNGRLFLTLCFGIALILFYFSFHIVMTIYCGIIAIITICWALFYPQYFRWRYKKHYKNHIRDNYSNRFGETEYLEIRDDVIFTKDKVGEGTINISEIEKVDETEKYFFVKITSGVSLIIPKYKIANSNNVRKKFESLGFAINEIKNDN